MTTDAKLQEAQGTPPTQDEFLTAPRAARMLGVKPQTLRKWRYMGWGPRYHRRGDYPQARVLYRRSDIEAWLAARAFSSTSEETNRAGETESGCE